MGRQLSSRGVEEGLFAVVRSHLLLSPAHQTTCCPKPSKVSKICVQQL